MKNNLVGILLVLLPVACSKNAGQFNLKGTDQFPNKVGDHWVYLVNDTLIERYSGLDTTITQFHMTVSVIDSIRLPQSSHGTRLPEGLLAYIWVYQYPGGADTNYVYQLGDTARFFDLNKNDYSQLTARQYLVPVRLHGTWPYEDGSSWKVLVDSQSDIIVGRLRLEGALHIYGNAGQPDKGFLIDEWVADKVGTVKRYVKTVGIGPYVDLTAWSLLSYDLK